MNELICLKVLMNGEYSNLIDKNTGFNKYVFL